MSAVTPRPLRITFLSVGDGWGGTEIQTAHQATALAQRGHEVTIFSFGLADFKPLSQWPGGDRVRINPCNVTGQPGRPDGIYGHVLPWRQTFALWKPIRGDVAIFPKGGFVQGGLWSNLMATLRFKRFITIEHSSCPQDHPRPSTRARWRVALTGTTVCVAQANAQQLIQHQGYSPKRVLTIHNGTDPARFHPCSQRRQMFRQQHGIGDHEAVILFVGRLTRPKGAHHALQAFAQVMKRQPQLQPRLVYCGQGDQEQALRQAAGELGLGERVVMIGYQDQTQLVYAGADIYLQASLHEGLSLALLEAMASGCRCVATDVGGTREVISRPGLGWLTPASDIDALGQALSAAILQPVPARDEMIRLGIEQVTLHFNHATQLGKMLELIETGRMPKSASASVR